MLTRLLAAAALSVAALAATPAPVSAADPVFTAKPCPADWADAGRSFEFGRLTVDEARDRVINASPCTQLMARDFLCDPLKAVDRSCLPTADTPLDFIE